MFHSRSRSIAAILVLLCSLPSLALPDEIVSAKNMALIVRLIGGESPHETAASTKYKAKLESKAVKAFRQQKRFQLATDPSKADLVCVLITFWPEVFFHGKSRWNRNAAERYTHPPQAIMVFKGGNSAHWDTLPLWMSTRAQMHLGSVVDLLQDFNAEVKRIGSGFSASDSNNAGESSMPKEADQNTGEGAASPAAAGDHGGPEKKEELDHPATQSPERAMVFCQSDFKNCNLSENIYSARTLLLCDEHSNCNKEAFRKTVTRWTLVQEPERADLIMIMSDDVAADAKFPTMYLFQGGPQPDWHAMPIFATVGGGGMFSKLRPDKRDALLESFQSFILETAPVIAPADKQP